MKITKSQLRNIIKEELEKVLNENTLQSALADSGKNDNPVIAISNNQFIQVRPIIQYDNNDQQVITGYAVDFGTRVSKGARGMEIKGSGKLSSSDGPSPSKAIEDALKQLQQLAAQGKGPYGTDPVDMSAPVRILS